MRKKRRNYNKTEKAPAIAELAFAVLLYGIGKLLQPKNTSTKK